jgi:hypothetical protein
MFILGDLCRFAKGLPVLHGPSYRRVCTIVDLSPHHESGGVGIGKGTARLGGGNRVREVFVFFLLFNGEVLGVSLESYTKFAGGLVDGAFAPGGRTVYNWHADCVLCHPAPAEAPPAPAEAEEAAVAVEEAAEPPPQGRTPDELWFDGQFWYPKHPPAEDLSSGAESESDPEPEAPPATRPARPIQTSGRVGKKRGPYRKEPSTCPDCGQLFSNKYEKYNHNRRGKCPGKQGPAPADPPSPAPFLYDSKAPAHLLMMRNPKYATTVALSGVDVSTGKRGRRS